MQVFISNSYIYNYFSLILLNHFSLFSIIIYFNIILQCIRFTYNLFCLLYFGNDFTFAIHLHFIFLYVGTYYEYIHIYTYRILFIYNIIFTHSNFQFDELLHILLLFIVCKINYQNVNCTDSQNVLNRIFIFIFEIIN